MKNVVKLFLCCALFSCSVSYAVEQSENKVSSNEGNKMEILEVRASHILVDSEELAKTILQEIKDNKISFEDAAKKYSQCPSGRNGGDLEYFGRGMMVKEFEDVAFSTPKGEIAGPVKTQFGYHLIKVTGTK